MIIFNLPRPLLVLLLCQLKFSSANRPARWDQSAHRVGNRPLPTNCSEGSAAPPGCGSQTHTLDLSYNDISSLTWSDIPCRTSCATRLDLSHNRIQEIHDGVRAGFPRLKELDLSSNLLHTVTQELWSGLQAMEVLDLRHNLLTGIPASAFAGLGHLRTVLLQNNSLAAIPQALCSVSSLRVLFLAGNRIASVDSASLHLCSGLQELHLEHNLISEVSPEAFWGMEKLKVLNLSSNLLKTMPVTTMQALRETGVAVYLHGNPWGLHCDQGGRCLGLRDTVVSTLHEDTALTLQCRGSRHGEFLYWQTPFGQWQNSSGKDDHAPLEILANGSLRIIQATPYHNGLYYCLFREGEGQSLHPYRVRFVPARSRKSRDTQGNTEVVSKSHFEAAVVASVTVTFLAGFSLGAFSRTYLNRCLQKTRAKETKENAVHYKRTTFRKGPEANMEDSVNIEICEPNNSRPKQITPPKKAPRTVLAREGEGDDSNQETPGGEDTQQEKMVPGDWNHHGDQEATRRQADDSLEELQTPQPAPRPSKRRVIKLYHYDEDGSPYNHVQEPEEAPLATQRSLSLTRLSNIMSVAAEADTSTLPSQGDEPSGRPPGGGTAVFELSA
ncbi:leucine-rich repeat and fibronectin type-III domain-containing protein 3 isoform X2 [Brienomyrus brachyistius]|uniref:leucine-rich repeat and fibronectin type-III domain-containing protein 3 isoform X2 n=1 Tax=Brienomyrus brachyistius TaxID=42636 RepID=UPI0020B1EC7A|nr:leucine-rich repeat and fibronectin type-III domain-containing protein 3 isoform X2 [Brienomyrus brachyistius]